jgi:hypothetical protein
MAATSFKFSPWVIVFLEKLTVAQLNKKLSTFYEKKNIYYVYCVLLVELVLIQLNPLPNFLNIY